MSRGKSFDLLLNHFNANKRLTIIFYKTDWTVEYKQRILDSSSYEDIRNAWLDMKREIDDMEYQEEIIYIRHLCGIDYEESLEEV